MEALDHMFDLGTAPQVFRPLVAPQLATWRVSSDRRGLILSVTYWDASEALVTAKVEYEWPGVHGSDLPRSVEEDLCRDVERHYGNCESSQYFEREMAVSL